MLPNNHPDVHERFEELCRAIKAVYASTYCENARTYIANTALRIVESIRRSVLQGLRSSIFALADSRRFVQT